MSTDKCPKCGSNLFWCENWSPRWGYCQSPDCAYETATTSAKIDAEVMLPAALHRIRELEARIAAKDETLKEIWADAGYYANNPQCGDLEDVLERINDIAREALKK